MAKKKSAAARMARLNEALASFSLHYGNDDTKLNKWQALCDDCGVTCGSSIVKCKAAIRTVSINIWDLIRARAQDNLPAPRYASKNALRNDLLQNPSRRFPLHQIKANADNKLLRALLVTIA